MAGEIVMRTARDNGVHVLPVDSEHNAIFQCLEGKRSTLNSDESRAGVHRAASNTENLALGVGRSALDVSDVRRIILTASGGPFRDTPRSDFNSVTPKQALKHPTWNMGPKITIDSATLFNKGLEMIEAHWLFDVEMGRVEVVIHPQSIVHSMVEFTDGSTLAQLSYSNMCFPIQYAVTWPDRVPNSLPPLDFSKLSKLEFFTPRYEDFPALGLARRAGKIGGTLPAVMNAANEVAVAAFLARQLRFPQIWEVVEELMNRHTAVAHPDLDAILQADQWARDEAQGCVQSLSR
jgi:1-deoxy-D-xylulose-5-phosphate reductoisomerase